MKKLLDIISQTDVSLTEAEDFGPPSSAQKIQGPITSSEDERVGVALQKLDQIGEMVDDLYNTISHLETIDAECDASLTSAYNVVDDLYAKIDEKYDIIPVDLDEEDYSDLEESFELEESFRPGYDFVPAPIGKNTFSASGLMKLWGHQMRAGKWADTFIGLYKDGTFSIINAADDTESKYDSGEQVLSAIRKMAKEGVELLGDSLNEVLSKEDPASEWIHDFVNSDAPQFKGKSKKERIKMALGAYYAAQKKEDIELDEAVDKAWLSKINALTQLKQKQDNILKQLTKPNLEKKEKSELDRELINVNIQLRKVRDEFIVKVFNEDLDEAVDVSKWKELAATGLMSTSDASQTLMAIKAIEDGRNLSASQLKLLANTAAILIQIITGDTAALSSVKRAAKE